EQDETAAPFRLERRTDDGQYRRDTAAGRERDTGSRRLRIELCVEATERRHRFERIAGRKPLDVAREHAAGLHAHADLERQHAGRRADAVRAALDAAVDRRLHRQMLAGQEAESLLELLRDRERDAYRVGGGALDSLDSQRVVAAHRKPGSTTRQEARCT